jgi:signal transduction histidine kinase
MSENPFRGDDAAAAARPLHDPAVVVRHVTDQIRAPLNAIESISCYLEMVLPRTEGRARRQLGRLRRELQQVNWILADALHFLRAVPPSLHPADLSELVANNLSEWSPPEGPQVRLDLDTDLPLIAVDPGQMQHLLRTLVIFFSRYARPGIPLVIRTAPGAGRARLEITCAVEDLPQQAFEALFQPFDTELPAGSGLALASVQRIAESHQARLETEFGVTGNVTLAVSFPAAKVEVQTSLA